MIWCPCHAVFTGSSATSKRTTPALNPTELRLRGGGRVELVLATKRARQNPVWYIYICIYIYLVSTILPSSLLLFSTTFTSSSLSLSTVRTTNLDSSTRPLSVAVGYWAHPATALLFTSSTTSSILSLSKHVITNFQLIRRSQAIPGTIDCVFYDEIGSRHDEL